jgi:hypothetical protein
MALVFPSLAWFEALREACNNDPTWRRRARNTCDARIAVKVGPAVYGIEFEAFEVARVWESEEAELEKMDFSIEMTPEAWKAMLEHIREHGAAQMPYRLNVIHLNTKGGIIKRPTPDPYREDLFWRFNEAFQAFFDTSSQLETVFAWETPPVGATS